MSESKVYMFPENNHGDAALWALANRNNDMNSMWPMMAMNGGFGGLWNNPLTH